MDLNADGNLAFQEIDELLANNLTHEEEDAVQAELRQLQADVVSYPTTRLAYADKIFTDEGRSGGPRQTTTA